MSARTQILTFEQVNRVYAAAKARRFDTVFPLMAWYKGACEFVTGMPEISRPDIDADSAAYSAFCEGRDGRIPRELENCAQSACDVSSAELWA